MGATALRHRRGRCRRPGRSPEGAPGRAGRRWHGGGAAPAAGLDDYDAAPAPDRALIAGLATCRYLEPPPGATSSVTPPSPPPCSTSTATGPKPVQPLHPRGVDAALRLRAQGPAPADVTADEPDLAVAALVRCVEDERCNGSFRHPAVLRVTTRKGRGTRGPRRGSHHAARPRRESAEVGAVTAPGLRRSGGSPAASARRGPAPGRRGPRPRPRTGGSRSRTARARARS
jgi:hypothetical protein